MLENKSTMLNEFLIIFFSPSMKMRQFHLKLRQTLSNSSFTNYAVNQLAE